MANAPITLPGYFDVALVINLAERPDRRRLVEREFQQAGWRDYKIFQALRFADAAGFKSSSWRGCFASHLECLRLAQERKLKNILIFEDDIALSSSIARLTPALIQTILALDWDFLYFGHELTGDIPRATRKTASIRFERYNGDIQACHFYAVHSRIIPRLITHFERNQRAVPGETKFGPMSSDGAYNTFRRYNEDVTTYVANPKLGWQRPSRSNISPRAVDSINALRPLAAMARSIKHFCARTFNRY
jgi:GR25 family glycosyltransferase involved in LPS biosynthesis